jgi:2',3'-cyclic-nucleotide 2'-phosphodiesterase (5'-nucleotidase family)
MPQTYKILGQVYPNANTLTNVYVTGASTSAVVNSIFLSNQQTETSNVTIILRPVNEALQSKHTVIFDETVHAASTYILNLGITMGPNMILAANTTYAADQPVGQIPTSVGRISFGAFGLEIT